ncbi:hypothetical protein SASPL_154351 [Salvia splendens]|uniref:Uncharacterized protein n=1 Tax=Salvia splendens TaxID=180675 RepID=A0A8X8VZX4_SALSN|nr:hypothetical protein SASPL_154351 [Salvia splendens]
MIPATSRRSLSTVREIILNNKSLAPTWTTNPLTDPKTDMVGNDEELLKLLDVLTMQDSSRQIISIVGMGGLARNAFENPLIVQHFDIRGGIDVECGRRIVFQRKNLKDPRVFNALPSARSLIINGGPLPSKFHLVKVLTRVEGYHPETIFQQVTLRYLVYKSSGDSRGLLLSSASVLWNVQILTINVGNGGMSAPPEIWNIRQLGHLEFNKLFLPDPPTLDQQEDSVLQNLQTLMNVVNFCFSEDVCKRIPNITKLHISYYDFSEECLRIDLGTLTMLQSLKCSFDKKMGDLALELTFPSRLQELSLSGGCLHFDNVTAVGMMLPHLQVVNLDLVTGIEWNLVEGAFPRLKSLSISNSDLINWTADDSHFPLLEKLVLTNLSVLNEITLGFGEIPTLGALNLKLCNICAAISSTKILEEQLNLGNEEIEVQVHFRDMETLCSFREKVDTTHFPKHNFDCGQDPIYQLHDQIVISMRGLTAALRFLKASTNTRPSSGPSYRC